MLFRQTEEKAVQAFKRQIIHREIIVMAVKTLLKNAMILTLNEKDEILKNTDILIQANK